MLVTELTFHNAIFPLKADAPLNMPPMFVTDSTFQPPMFWLNADAVANIPAMFVTDPTSHSEISSLNVVLPLNKEDISVIRDVHQLPIGNPQALLKSMHCSEAVFRLQPWVI